MRVQVVKLEVVLGEKFLDFRLTFAYHLTVVSAHMERNSYIFEFLREIVTRDRIV